MTRALSWQSQAIYDNHDKEVKKHGSKDEIEKNGPEEGTFL